MALNDALLEELLESAKKASLNAFSPFSHFPVGAALLTSGGEIFTGCNVENSSFGLSICAERVAVFKAISEGKRDFVAIAIYAPQIVPPCGACLQVLSQFVPSPNDFLIISSDRKGNVEKWTLSQLFPLPFTF
jgi:cytidine deaminase